MKLVLPGGTGHLGLILARAFRSRGDEVVVLSRSEAPGVVVWDGWSVGDWAREIAGADVVVNLAGRNVNCRYNKTHLQQMLDSRIDSARAVGAAIEKAADGAGSAPATRLVTPRLRAPTSCCR